MAEKFRDFQLTGLADFRFPRNAVRDSFEVYWEEFPANEDDPETIFVRRVQTLVMHVEVNTVSTANTAFNNFILEEFIFNPKVAIEDTNGRQGDIVFPGTWEVEKITARDQQNGTTLVTLALILRDEDFFERTSSDIPPPLPP